MQKINFQLKFYKNSLYMVIFLFILFFSNNSYAQFPTANTYLEESKALTPGQSENLKAEESSTEYRFLWVTRYQIQSTKDISLVVERAHKYNFNALFVQICALGEAYYHSQINPWGKGVTKDFDPLAELVKQAHAYGIEVHAWINVAYIWGIGNELPQDSKHVIHAHPEWVLKDKKGRSILKYASWEKKWAKISGLFLDLGIPQVQDYLESLCLELVANYPIDGLHLDYIRYSNNDLGYSEEVGQVFQEKYQIDPRALVVNKSIAIKVFGKERYEELLSNWDIFRQQQVENLVTRIYQKAKMKRSNIKISAAVVADADRAKKDYFQDWPIWLKKGIVDFIAIMSYSDRDSLVQRQVGLAVQMAQDYDRGLIVGLGAWRQKPEAIIEKVLFTRKVREEIGFKNLWGISLFSYDALIKNNSDYLLELRKEIFPTKAKVPIFDFRKTDLAEPLAKEMLMPAVEAETI